MGFNSNSEEVTMLLDRRTFNTGLLASLGLLQLSDSSAAAKPTIGFLTTADPENFEDVWSPQLTAFRGGLMEGGYTIGKDVLLEGRLAGSDPDQVEAYAIELAAMKVPVIVAAGGPMTALAARKATQTIPIVFTTVVDPVKLGLVQSLGEPRTNATGTAGQTSELDHTRLEILQRAIPSARHIGVLVAHHRPGVKEQTEALRKTASYLGLTLQVQSVRSPGLFAQAVSELAAMRPDAILITADPMFNFNKTKLVPLIESLNIPAIWQWKEQVTVGGLMSYGPDIKEAYAVAGQMTAQIIDGARPETIPVRSPTSNSLNINHVAAVRLKLSLNPKHLLPGAGAAAFKGRP
jgi:putative ABC transport system substrate-binding protein